VRPGCALGVQLEFLLAALLDLDEVGEGQGALLLAQQLDSPDVATRSALAQAPALLHHAGTVWGNNVVALVRQQLQGGRLLRHSMLPLVSWCCWWVSSHLAWQS